MGLFLLIDRPELDILHLIKRFLMHHSFDFQYNLFASIPSTINNNGLLCRTLSPSPSTKGTHYD